MSNLIYAYKKVTEQKIIYVGQTIDIKNRHDDHIKRDPYNPNIKEYNYPLSRGIRKYGEKEYELIILEDNISLDKLDEREIFWIAYYDTYYNGYNQTKGGKSPNKPIYKDEVILNVIEMLKDEHFSYKDIAEKTGLSITHIYNINIGTRRPQKDIAYPIRPKYTKGTKGQKFNLEELIAIHEDLKNTNLDFKTLGKKYNCCPETISHINQGNRKCYQLKNYDYPVRLHPHSNAKKMFWENK